MGENNANSTFIGIFTFPKTKDLGRKFIPKTFLGDFWEHFWENHALKIQENA